MAIVIDGMHGMGDNIFQRAFVREIDDLVYLRTSWPQLYKDLENVLPVKPNTRLRTQKKNVRRQRNKTWHQLPPLPSEVRKIRYGGANLKAGSIIRAMKKCLGVEPRVFDLPAFKSMGIDTRYAVIRPVTVRTEWRNIARNPYAEYIDRAAEILRDSGYTVVSVADLVDGEEWAESLPYCDIDFTHGELCFEQLMGLVQHADVVVGGVGWIVPAAIAAGVRLVTVFGGHGLHNDKKVITDEPMDLENARWIYPDKFCMCQKMLHCCEKTITDFDDKFMEAINGI